MHSVAAKWIRNLKFLSGRSGFVKYISVGIFNTIFGICLYFLLIFLGVNMFVAQAVGVCIGLIVNYFTYYNVVFSQNEHAPLKFLISYIGLYPLQFMTLYILHIFIKSPYMSGLLTRILISLINYAVLKCNVFTKIKKT